MTNNFNEFQGIVEVGDRIRVAGFYSTSTIIEGLVSSITSEIYKEAEVLTYLDLYGLPIGTSQQRVHLTYRAKPKVGDYISVFEYKTFARMVNELEDGTVFTLNGKKYRSLYGGADEIDDPSKLWRNERELYKEVRVDKTGSGFEITEVSNGKRYS